MKAVFKDSIKLIDAMHYCLDSFNIFAIEATDYSWDYINFAQHK